MDDLAKRLTERVIAALTDYTSPVDPDVDEHAAAYAYLYTNIADELRKAETERGPLILTPGDHKGPQC